MPGPGADTTALLLQTMLKILALVFVIGTGGFLVRDLVAGSVLLWPLRVVLLSVLVGCAIVLHAVRIQSTALLRLLEWTMFGAMIAYLAIPGHASLAGYLEAEKSGLALAAWTGMAFQFVILLAGYCIFVPNTWRRAVPMIALVALAPVAVGGWAWAQRSDALDVALGSGGAGQVTDILVLLGAAAVLALVATHLVDFFRTTALEARGKFMYDLVRRIDIGGMGEVWLGKHQMLSRPVAIKWIRPEALAHGDKEQARLAVRRFEVEADATATLRSPHTIEIYDYGVTKGGIFYYAMEYLEGADLESLVRRYGPVDPERAVHFLRQACESLAEAHRQGLVHRDIKPANLFAARLGLIHDFTKVLDFGLALPGYLRGTDVKLTQEGTTTGTPAYMAPEMFTGKEGLDGRGDIYALGCVGYWLLTGTTVFDETTPVGMALAHTSREPVPPSKRTELDLPAELDGIILRCLEKTPGKRFQTVEELGEALENLGLHSEWDPRRAAVWWSTHQPGSARERSQP